MKKLLLVGAIVLGFGANAQELHFGAVAGLNATSLRTNWVKEFEYYNKATPIGGVYAGGYIQKSLSKGSLFAEAQFTTFGAKFKDTQAETYYGITEDFSMKASGVMFAVPVYYEYDVTEKIGVDAGAYAGVILSLKRDGGDGSGKVASNTLDGGLLVGAKYKITDKLSAVARYNFGLLDIDADSYRSNNSIFQVGVQYQIK
ncbi:outer membrane beta-barrel protein [Daejeonia sp. YH14]|uniref:outer membrane beta-barrel protein n=1 Tax=Daejeonia sp. YH14 TaxID=3439042 RepID=UPI003F498704